MIAERAVKSIIELLGISDRLSDSTIGSIANDKKLILECVKEDPKEGLLIARQDQPITFKDIVLAISFLAKLQCS